MRRASARARTAASRRARPRSRATRARGRARSAPAATGTSAADHVADAADGLDDVARGPELAPEVVHVEIDHLGLRVEGEVPDELLQLHPREDPPAVLHQT